MRFGKWTLDICLLGSLVMLQSSLTHANPTAREELAPGFNDRISRSSSANEMRQCNAKAIQYWKDRLDKALSRTGARCEQANQPEICKKRLEQSQTAWQDYVDMMAEYVMEVNGGGSEGLVEQGAFRAEAIRAQVRILE